MDPLRSKYQRDVNCLAEPDRSTRTRALKKLEDALFGKRSCDFDEPGSRSAFLSQVLLDPLLGRLEDPVEKCREVALGLLSKLLRDDEHGNAKDKSRALEPDTVDALCARALEKAEKRMGQTPFAEESEELRLSWMEFATEMVEHPNCRAAVSRELSRIVKVVATACGGDSFPDNKKQCAICCVKLCEQFPDAMHFHLGTLLAPLLSNMGHQHSKVRQSSLEAIKSLALTCAASSSTFDEHMRERILPAIRNINHDRSSAVRIQGTHLVSELMLRMPNADRYYKDLLPIVLFGLADTAKQIQDLTLETIESVGERITASHLAALAHKGAGNTSAAAPPPPPPQLEREDNDMGGEGGEGGCDLPEPFTRRPGPGARQLVVQTLPSALPAILSEAQDWTAQERFRAVSLLRCMLVYAEESAQPFAESIADTLFSSSMDEEQAVRDAAVDCARLLGRNLSTPELLTLVLSRCHGTAAPSASTHGGGERPEESATRRLGALSVLTGVVLGLPSSPELVNHLDRVAEALGAPTLCDSDSVDMQVHALHAIQAVLERLLGEIQASESEVVLRHSATCRLLRGLLVLVTSGADPETGLQSEAEDSVALLAACAGHLDAEGNPEVRPLAATCSKTLLPAAVAGRDVDTAGADGPSGPQASKAAKWTKYTADRRVFDQLVRRVGVDGLDQVDQLGLVVSVLEETAPVERDADLRLCMLSLLESMVSSASAGQAGKENALGSALDKYLGRLVNDVISPNLVWRAGRVASTIRKVSVFALCHMIGESAAQAAWFFEQLEKLMPSLKACLDDMEADTRRFTCLVLERLFRLLGQHGRVLDHFMVTNLYHDIIKRFDDADDAVRIASCQALLELIRVAPQDALKGTPADYITDTALIHMDDAKAEVQIAVFGVLEGLVRSRVAVDSILAKANVARAQHRSPDLCDRVVALCRELEAS